MMSNLKVLHFPDVRLKKKAETVAEIDNEIQQLVNKMYETMYEQKGVGLAATQVGIHLRIFVMDVSDNQSEKICAINPEIISVSGTQSDPEGCLSYPGVFDNLTRAMTVRFKALDIDGKPYEMEATGLMARCVQHEVDHLNGMLFVDRLSKLKQERARKKLEKLRRANNN